MKVFATKLDMTATKVVMVEFPSKRAFEHNESWCDPKWISVATTADLDTYDFPYSKGMVVYSQDQIDSWNLLHEQYNKQAKKSPC